MALVGRIAIEMVAGVLFGGFIGWLLDNWLNTTPLLMIVLLFVGAGAGTLNLWRMANGYGLSAGYFSQEENQDEKSDKE